MTRLTFEKMLLHDWNFVYIAKYLEKGFALNVDNTKLMTVSFFFFFFPKTYLDVNFVS